LTVGVKVEPTGIALVVSKVKLLVFEIWMV
jgi:hypothetical protein